MAAMLDNRARFMAKSKSATALAKEYHASPTETPLPDMIIPNLYLTDLPTARIVMLPTYPRPGRPVIKYVLSLLDSSISQPHPKPVNADKFVQKLIVVDDTTDTDLLVHLDEACDWIEEMMSKQDGGILVHCHLGQSRSASVVIAYLMRTLHLDFQKAWDKVKFRRIVAKPNPGFRDQLILWSQMDMNITEPDPEVEGQLRKKDGYLRWKEERRLRIQRLAMA